MDETQIQVQGEQAPPPELSILSPDKALAHWQLDQDIANATANGASQSELELLQFQRTIIDAALMTGLATRTEEYYADPGVLERVRVFRETHGVKQELDPYTVRVELAMRARWNLSGHNPDDYSAEDRQAIESGWYEAAEIQRQIERLIEKRDGRKLRLVNERLANGVQSAQ